MNLERLRSARLAKGMTLEEAVTGLAGLGVSLSKAGLSKYELGKSMPPDDIVAALYRVYNVPLSYFYAERRVSIRWLGFRKHSALTQTRQDQIAAEVERRVEGHLDLLHKLDLAHEHTPLRRSKVSTVEDAEQVALKLRDSWALGLAPIESMVHMIENQGGVVVQFDDADGHFDGLSGYTSDDRPVVVVNDKAIDRLRFSLAHELGHLVIDADEADEKTQETLANRFAGAFLVPASVARRELGVRRRQLRLEELPLLKLKYGVSMQAWVRRAYDAGIIDKAHYGTLFKIMSARGWRRTEPFELEGFDEKPRRLLQLTLRALGEGLIDEVQARSCCPEISRWKHRVTLQVGKPDPDGDASSE